jgi:pimeloyl-ACP methyl ester carboxylesterase
MNPKGRSLLRGQGRLTTKSGLGHLLIRRKSTASKPPLLLIPGAFMAADSMTAWAKAFAGNRTVIVIDQQGHGRTPDTSREMSYERFADDAAALLRALRWSARM